MNRSVVVTGATGFAGSHLLDQLLAAGYRVRVPVRATSNLRWIPRERVETVAADVRDPASLRRLVAGAEWVFHFGGVTRVARREEFFEVNTAGTQALAEAFLAEGETGGLFLFCSSLAAGGPALAADRPRREEDPPHPINAYGESKLAAERWLEQHLAPRARLLCIRPPAVYGPRDEAVLTFFRLARSGWLPVPGPRDGRQSLIHAEDLAAACRLLAEAGAAGTFQVSDGNFYTWNELADAIGRALGRRVRPLHVPIGIGRLAGAVAELAGRAVGHIPVVNREKIQDVQVPFWICDTTRLRGAGFAPRFELDGGIAQTIEWCVSVGWL